MKKDLFIFEYFGEASGGVQIRRLRKPKRSQEGNENTIFTGVPTRTSNVRHTRYFERLTATCFRE